MGAIAPILPEPLPQTGHRPADRPRLAGPGRGVRRRGCGRPPGATPLALRELLLGAEPGGLSELVTDRLTVLTPPTRHVVELVACGEPASLSVLERIAGLPALDAADQSGLIVVERSGGRVGGPGLSDRERQVLALLASGERDQDIAHLLAISVRTVRSHLDRIREKTGRRRRPDLTRLAMEKGIVRADAQL